MSLGGAISMTTHRDALEVQLAALGVSDTTAAEVQLAFGLADVLDEMPDVDLYREYRMALKALREAVGGDSLVDAELRDLVERLGGTDLLDTANK